MREHKQKMECQGEILFGHQKCCGKAIYFENNEELAQWCRLEFLKSETDFERHMEFFLGECTRRIV